MSSPLPCPHRAFFPLSPFPSLEAQRTFFFFFMVQCAAAFLRCSALPIPFLHLCSWPLPALSTELANLLLQSPLFPHPTSCNSFICQDHYDSNSALPLGNQRLKEPPTLQPDLRTPSRLLHVPSAFTHLLTHHLHYAEKPNHPESGIHWLPIAASHIYIHDIFQLCISLLMGKHKS